MNDSLTFEKKELKFLLEREFFIHIAVSYTHLTLPTIA